MPNLQRIQLAWNKTGVTVIGRVVRQGDLYYYDFITGGNTFVATDSANTRISMPARSAPQDYIYESATFDIETWNNGWYEWQSYDSSGKLLGLTPYYIYGGQIATDSMLSTIKERTDNLPDDPTSETNATSNKIEIITEIDINESLISAVKNKTDNLPTDPTSESQATANKNSIITEVNANETKIDLIKAKTDNLPSDPTSEANATINTNSIIAEVNTVESKVDNVQTDTTAIKAKTDNLPVDPASQSEIESAISDAEANLISLLNDISDAIGDIVPNIFTYSISDTAPVNSFEWYTRYISKQVG